MTDSTKIPFFKYGTFFPEGSRVKKQGTGFGASLVYGTVISHDFFGEAIISWED